MSTQTLSENNERNSVCTDKNGYHSWRTIRFQSVNVFNRFELTLRKYTIFYILGKLIQKKNQ